MCVEKSKLCTYILKMLKARNQFVIIAQVTCEHLLHAAMVSDRFFFEEGV